MVDQAKDGLPVVPSPDDIKKVSLEVQGPRLKWMLTKARCAWEMIASAMLTWAPFSKLADSLWLCIT